MWRRRTSSGNCGNVKGRALHNALACLALRQIVHSIPPIVPAADRHVAYVAFPLFAAAVVVSALVSGLLAAAFVEAAGAPAAGADFQLVVVLFAVPADVSARGCVVAPPAAVAAFAVPVGACAPTRHHGCFVAAPAD